MINILNESHITDYPTFDIPQWQLNALKHNYGYNNWGNGQDYMVTSGKGFDVSIEINSVNNLFELDEYNELINFYFQITKQTKPCEACAEDGYSTFARKISEEFKGLDITLYSHDIEILVKAGRHRINKNSYKFENEQWFVFTNKQWELTTAPNIPAQETFRFLDCISTHALLEAYCEEYKEPLSCQNCNGHGYHLTDDLSQLQLQMWFIHPRKGASKGVLLTNIEEAEMPLIIDYLKTAKQRILNKFSNI